MKLDKKMVRFLETYIEAGGDATHFDDLPVNVQQHVIKMNDHETIRQDVSRWLSDKAAARAAQKGW